MNALDKRLIKTNNWLLDMLTIDLILNTDKNTTFEYGKNRAVLEMIIYNIDGKENCNQDPFHPDNMTQLAASYLIHSLMLLMHTKFITETPTMNKLYKFAISLQKKRSMPKCDSLYTTLFNGYVQQMDFCVLGNALKTIKLDSTDQLGLELQHRISIESAQLFMGSQDSYAKYVAKLITALQPFCTEENEQIYDTDTMIKNIIEHIDKQLDI
jgi:hypothetical protein